MRKASLGVVATGLALAASLSVAAPSGFDSNRAYEHLRRIVAFGPRPAGSPALDATRRYLRDELAALGLKATDQAFDASTPTGPLRMTNLVVTIPGARPERLVFGGHYDTKLFPQFRFVGANDAGSSTAFLLELARVLKARKNHLTIEIVFFDGEEALIEWSPTDGTYGSRHYVEAAKRAGTVRQLAALILVDMIGGRNLVLEREAGSTPWLLNAMVQSAQRLKVEQVFAPVPSPIEDDHLPFLQAGIPAVDLIGFNHYQAFWHTPDDTLDKVSARSLQVVGDIVLGALPQIEARLTRGSVPVTRKRPSTTR